MISRRAIACLALLLATGLSPASAADLTSVTIVDMPRPQSRWGYAPTASRVAVGAWVTWSNDGVDAHTVTALDGVFDSGELNPSEGFSWFFDQPGTFEYVCTLHPWMKGRIVVFGEEVPVETESLPESLVEVGEEISGVFEPGG